MKKEAHIEVAASGVECTFQVLVLASIELPPQAQESEGDFGEVKRIIPMSPLRDYQVIGRRWKHSDVL